MGEGRIIPLEEVETEGGTDFSIRSESLDALRDEWIALHTAVHAPGPFQRPEWHDVWLRHFGKRIDPVYLAVRRDEHLVGVAALSLQDGVAAELGDPGVRDYAGPLAAEGYDNDVVLALLDWVAEDMTPSLDLWGMRKADPLVALFQAEAADNGWDLAIEQEAVAPVAELSGGWEAYLAGLSKHDRHELRRKLRHLEANGAALYTSTGDAAEIDAGLDTLFAMMGASHDGKSHFLSSEMQAFFRDLARTFAPLGLMRLGTLSLDGRSAAMLFTFEDEDAVYLYNSGYQPDLGNLAAGLLSKAYALRDAIDRGKSRFDFLRGGEDYKRRLGGEPREIVRLRFTRR